MSSRAQPGKPFACASIISAALLRWSQIGHNGGSREAGRVYEPNETADFGVRCIGQADEPTSAEKVRDERLDVGRVLNEPAVTATSVELEARVLPDSRRDVPRVCGGNGVVD